MSTQTIGTIFAFTLLFTSISITETFGNVDCPDTKKEIGLNSKIPQVDKIFENVNSKKTPGCALGVIFKGCYVFKASYGMANLEHDIKITTQSVFRIASLSKQFTAMAIALLVENGDLSLDDDVRKHLPDLIEYQNSKGAPVKVTIRHMLQHLSGMYDYDNIADLLQFYKIIFGNIPPLQPLELGDKDYITPEEFYDRLKTVPLSQSPGAPFLYSNFAYFLLSKVVKEVLKKVSKVKDDTLPKFAERNIFNRLLMTNTFFNDDGVRLVHNRVQGYSGEIKSPPELKDFRIYMTNLDWVGDGGVFTTIDDFFKWDQNFYNNQLGKSDPALIDRIEKPDPDSYTNDKFSKRYLGEYYAFGQYVGTYKGIKGAERRIAHSGDWVGFSSYYARFPKLRFSVVTFCNLPQERWVNGQRHDYRTIELADRVIDVFFQSVKSTRP